MRLIDAELLTTNIAQIAKNCARSDAQKALIGRILFMIDNMPTDDKNEPTVKAVTEEQYNAAVVKLLNDLRTRACGAGPISTADKGVLLVLDALMKCLLKEELFGGNENEETNHSGMR